MSLFFSLISSGQGIIPDRPNIPLPLPTPPISVKLPEQESLQPIEVAEADITAEINGVLAETVVTLKFFNPNARVLEGELSFPLPSEAFVAGYALDVNGRLVDGVIVEKEKARVVFDEITRQGIDPGLVEQSGGNTFKTKLYPLPARGTRTVQIRYVSQVAMTEEKGNPKAYYIQPLRFPNKLERFRLKVDVAAPLQPPKVEGGSLANLEFTNWRTMYTATTELKDIELTEDLYVAIMTRPEESLAVQTQPREGRHFAWHRLLDLSALASASTVKESTPVVLWDASLSRDKSEHDAELAFLKAALAKAEKITLIVFRNVPETSVEFTSVDELVKTLETVVYDGGTCLSAALAMVPKGAEVFLFCDGLDTLSAAGPLFDPSSFRLSAFFADKDQNAPFLRGLATKSGGICADLRTTSIQDALRLWAAPSVVVTRVEADGTELTDAFAWRLDGNRLAVAGPLADGAKNLAITVTCGNQSQTFQPAIADEDTLPDGRALRTFYGQLKIAQLIADGADEEALTAAGKKYQLVTPTTSLMVLDSLAQYLRYRIRPPESLSEMRAQYDAQVGEKSEDEKQGFQLTPNSPEAVISMWTALVAWHKKDFPRKNTAEPKHSTTNHDEPLDDELLDEGGAVPEEDGVGAGDVPLRARAAGFNAVQMEAAAFGVLADGAEMRSLPDRESSDNAVAPRSTAKTTLQAWNSNAPYLEALKHAGDHAYEAYLKERSDYMTSPGFYMDCADALAEAGQRDLALRVLTNLAEIELENKQLMRILGYKLRFLGELAQAETVFRRVVKLAPEEPQSYRDLALTLDEEEKFQEAVDVMMTLVKYRFDSRFPEIEAIALTEINRMVARAERKGIAIKDFDAKYRHLVDTDIRIVMNWDADMMDIDLWTTDPFHVKCYYGYRLTPTGGRNSCDFTQGYGPEEFMIRDAIKGKYTIQAHYYASHSQKVLGPVTVYVEVFTNFGRLDEKREVLTFRLNGNKDVVTIGAIDHDGTNRPPRHDAPFDYQVRKGDTLSSIAREQLGDEGRVKDILALNPELTADGKLTVGLIIKLPPTTEKGEE